MRDMTWITRDYCNECGKEWNDCRYSSGDKYQCCKKCTHNHR